MVWLQVCPWGQSTSNEQPLQHVPPWQTQPLVQNVTQGVATQLGQSWQVPPEQHSPTGHLVTQVPEEGSQHMLPGLCGQLVALQATGQVVQLPPIQQRLVAQDPTQTPPWQQPVWQGAVGGLQTEDGGVKQIPFMQSWPGAQQSVIRSGPPKQLVVPVGHTHPPPLLPPHTFGALQQLVSPLPEHAKEPFGHTHWPPTQEPGLPHMKPQRPQSLFEVWRFVQMSLQQLGRLSGHSLEGEPHISGCPCRPVGASPTGAPRICVAPPGASAPGCC